MRIAAKPKLPLLTCLVACLLAPAAAKAYVTSATLELMADDKAGVYLNGKLLLDDKRCEMLYNWYMCLSTSDNTLPLELFKNNQDNLLGIINYDVYGGEAEISYRLTINQSNGDPIVIWSEPGATKFLNLHRNQPDPPGWQLAGFDDSKWPFANAVVGLGGNFIRLPDDRLKSFMGAQGFVPIVAPSSDAHTIPQDRNLYRNHFTFPNAIAKVELRTNPKVARQGQLVAVRIVPGRDAADISNFSLFATLPEGLEPSQINDQGRYDAATRAIRWHYRDVGKAAEFLTLSAQAVLESSGWKNPDRALGPFRPELKAWRDGGNTPAEQKLLGAAFWPGMPAWFKTSRLPYADGPDAPQVLGIIFRVQHMAGGGDTPYKKGVNDIYLNYSFDGSGNGALKEDRRISFCANTGMWQTGYYDATEDRAWTWEQLNNLRVKIVSRQFGNRQLGRVASIQATVRAVRLQNCSPTFLAKVISAKCENLAINAGVVQGDGKAHASDRFSLPVNPEACPSPVRIPTPRPLPTPTPQPAPKAGATAPPTPLPAVPTPTPQGPGIAATKLNLGLGCLSSSPEPFKRGGVFIYFCLKADAKVSIAVSNASGQILRTMPAVGCRAGDNQIFFNATDDAGRPLRPGAYTYALTASDSASSMVQHSTFHRAPEDLRR